MVGVTTQSQLKQLPLGAPPPPGGNAEEFDDRKHVAAHTMAPMNSNFDMRQTIYIVCRMSKLLFMGAIVCAATCFLSSNSSAFPPGGGGAPSGSCFNCDCVVTPTIGGKTCGCPRHQTGGSGCDITFTPGWG